MHGEAPQENIYRRVNSVLFHRRSCEMEKWKHYIWHLVTGVRSLPKYPKEIALYRGIDAKFFKPEDYTQGTRIIWHSFTSCSQSNEQAKNFMKVILCLSKNKIRRIRKMGCSSSSKPPKAELLADLLPSLPRKR